MTMNEEDLFEGEGIWDAVDVRFRWRHGVFSEGFSQVFPTTKEVISLTLQPMHRVTTATMRPLIM
jgi:hypothetical protein